jgi:hypothetical protein
MQQYNTERGAYPVAAVDAQLREAYARTPIPNKYPGIYRNKEVSASGVVTQNFDNRFERAYGSKSETTRYVEYPVLSRDFNPDRPLKSAKKVEQKPEPRDRGDRLRHPRNDPGPLRGIYAIDKNDDRRSEPLGLNYHPLGNPRGNVRAPLEPISTKGRQYMYQHKGEIPSGGRSPTWPGRGRDSAAHTRFEDNHVNDTGSWLSRQAKKKDKEEKKLKKKEKLLEMQTGK